MQRVFWQWKKFLSTPQILEVEGKLRSILFLLDAFLEGRLSANEFSAIYFDFTQQDLSPILGGLAEQEAIMHELLVLRSSCEAYVEDEDLLRELKANEPSEGWYLDEKGLRSKSFEIRNRLKQILNI